MFPFPSDVLPFPSVQFGVEVHLSKHGLTKIITISPFFLLENLTNVCVCVCVCVFVCVCVCVCVCTQTDLCAARMHRMYVCELQAFSLPSSIVSLVLNLLLGTRSLVQSLLTRRRCVTCEGSAQATHEQSIYQHTH